MLHHNQLKTIVQLVLITLSFLVGCELNAQVDSGYVKVKNCNLYYEIYGSGEPIVFLNGGPGISSSGYRYIPEKFDSSFQVILFDQRGTGRSVMHSIKPSTVNLKVMVDDLEKLRIHLGINKWNVIGQSFGGTYALHYAAKHSDQINKLVLISSAGIGRHLNHGFQKFHDPDVSSLSRIEVNLLDTVKRLKKKKPLRVSKVLRYNRALRSRYYIYNKDNLLKQVNWFLNEAEFNSNVGLYLREFPNYESIQNRLRNVKTKTLILYGSSDFIPFSVPLSIKRFLENSELIVLRDCGHSIWLDKEQEAKDHIHHFLNTSN